MTVKYGFMNIHSQNVVAINPKRGEAAGPDCNPVVPSEQENLIILRNYFLKNWVRNLK